jgi:hypothetical protein
LSFQGLYLRGGFFGFLLGGHLKWGEGRVTGIFNSEHGTFVGTSQNFRKKCQSASRLALR